MLMIFRFYMGYHSWSTTMDRRDKTRTVCHVASLLDIQWYHPVFFSTAVPKASLNRDSKVVYNNYTPHQSNKWFPNWAALRTLFISLFIQRLSPRTFYHSLPRRHLNEPHFHSLFKTSKLK